METDCLHLYLSEEGHNCTRFDAGEPCVDTPLPCPFKTDLQGLVQTLRRIGYLRGDPGGEADES